MGWFEYERVGKDGSSVCGNRLVCFDYMGLALFHSILYDCCSHWHVGFDALRHVQHLVENYGGIGVNGSTIDCGSVGTGSIPVSHPLTYRQRWRVSC